MWRTRLLGILAILLIGLTRTASAQLGAEPSSKFFQSVISLDSTSIRAIGASPDGRWLSLATQCSSTACSAPWGATDGIWMMPADGRAKATRLLSAGYIDRSPAWFPSGDKLAFVSDRLTRDGSHRTFGMTVSIDPTTGQASGLPRQITIDEAAFLAVSPDGKSVVYGVRGENAIKVVPANGGASRTLVKMPTAAPPFIWSNDGRTLYFVVQESPRLPPYGGVWYKVSATGGPIARAYQNQAAMPYPPNTDLHLVHVQRTPAEGRGIKRVELYDAKEQLVGTVNVTSEVTLNFPRGTPGVIYATKAERRYVNSLLTLDGAITRTLVASRFAWVNGWLDNATLTIDGRDSAGNHFVATLDTAGREGRHVTLPAGSDGCCGWEGVVGSAMTFWRGGTIYTADARTGSIRALAGNPIGGRGASYGRGGLSADGDRFLVKTLNGQQVELRGITADGRSTLLRTFAKSDSLRSTAVHGDLVAWAIVDRDSVTVFAARGPTGRPHKLTAQRFTPSRFFQLAWSFDATMLAITEPSLSVIHVDATGAPRQAPVTLNSRATEAWSLRWTPDNRSVVVIAIPTGARDEVLVRVPVDPKVAPTFYGRDDEWAFVSPDGKRVAYPAVRTLGTTVYRTEFVRPGSDGSDRKP